MKKQIICGCAAILMTASLTASVLKLAQPRQELKHYAELSGRHHDLRALSTAVTAAVRLPG